MGIATEPHYFFAPEDVMYVDWGCIYRGYFSDTGTTLAMREMSPALNARFGWIRECMDAGINQLRPGVRASAVQQAMGETLHAHGPVVSYPHGHSFGLDVRDYPILAPDTGLPLRDECIDVSSDLPLEQDMVINLEAPIFMPGVGSVHLEESFVITANGCRPLVPQERSQPIVPN
jgi:Xaa-Pro aminopeptidase